MEARRNIPPSTIWTPSPHAGLVANAIGPEEVKRMEAELNKAFRKAGTGAMLTHPIDVDVQPKCRIEGCNNPRSSSMRGDYEWHSLCVMH